MKRSISEIEREIRALDRTEQTRLLYALLEELDGPADPDAAQMWLVEIQRRSAELDAGLTTTESAENVFQRAIARLKR